MLFNPAFYIFCGFFLAGGSIVFLRKDKPLSFFFLLAALWAAVVVTGILVCDYRFDSLPVYGFLAAIAFVCGFAVLRFPIAGGLSFSLLILIAVVLYSPLFLQIPVSLQREQHSAFSVLPSDSQKLVLKIDRGNGREDIVELEGDEFMPVLLRIRYSPFLFFKPQQDILFCGMAVNPVLPQRIDTPSENVFLFPEFYSMDSNRFFSMPGITVYYPLLKPAKQHVYYNYRLEISRTGDLYFGETR